MSKHLLGAQLYTVRDFTKTIPDIARTLKKISAIGYTGVQVSGIGPVNSNELAKVLEDSGLTVAGTHVRWERFINELDKVIAEHKMWRCKHTAIPGLFNNKYRSLDGLKRFLDELGPVSEKLAKEGIDLSYHNHNHELSKYGKKTWLEMLYEQASPEYLKAEIDVYWIQAGGGDPAAWIKKYRGRQPLLHLKDMVVVQSEMTEKKLSRRLIVGNGAEKRFAEIGEGNLNWPSILQAALESSVEWYVVEQDTCYNHDPFESLAISYHNLVGMGLN